MKPTRSYVLCLTSEVLLIVYVTIAARVLGEAHASSIIKVVLPDPAEARIIRLFNGILDVFRDHNLLGAFQNLQCELRFIVLHIGEHFFVC